MNNAKWSKELLNYWNTLPTTIETAATYEQLGRDWQMSRRNVRQVLHELSKDNGDEFVLIRSSKHKGFFKTNDINEIQQYGKECRNRTANTATPQAKINRILALSGEKEADGAI